MKLTPIENRRRWLAAALGALALLATVLLSRRSQVRLPMALLIGLALAALAALPLLYRAEARGAWGMLAVNAMVALTSVLALHCPMFVWTSPNGALLHNALTVMALLCLATALTGGVKTFGALWLTVCLVFGLIDVAVVQFSENVISFSNFFAIRTAASVASGYRLRITRCILLAAGVYLVSMWALLRVKVNRAGIKRLPVRAVALVCCLACAGVEFVHLRGEDAMIYKGQGVTQNGIINELLLEVRDSIITPPEGYSDAAVEALSKANAGEASSDRPHVIAVMIEAFSDLTVLGDVTTDVDCMPYTRGLADESIHGWAMASTLGGGTARSEWEFLTGHTMAFMPKGSMPFEQYMKEDELSCVKLFQRAGYSTVAMHPYFPSGWHRDTVYPMLGFEQRYFIDDLEWDGIVRTRVSDSAFVHQLIHLFETREPDKPLFLFGVTMQNHGGYNQPNFPATVHLTGMQGSYPDVEQYLSLIRLTDDAIRELVEYFRGSDEKVQLVFFGDHQPAVDEGFDREAGVKDPARKYIVPFVIWNNYDPRAEEVPLTSFNYLMPRLLKEIGLTGAPYFNFLSALSEKVPSVSTNGYALADGALHPLNDDPDGLLDDYRAFQYASMFRHNLDPALFLGEAG